MPEIINNQRKIRFEIKPLENFVKTLGLKVIETKEKDFAVAFISDRKMRQFNKQFRGKNSTTDVLSFPYEADEFESETDAFTREDASDDLAPEGVTHAFLGDIVISAEQAERQAKENGLTLENEIKQLILHGLLHLCSYDHETDNGEMNARELELRENLGI